MKARKQLAAALFLLLVIMLPVYATHGISTSSSRTEVNVGQRATYALNVTNTGGDNITQIVSDFSGFLFAGATCPAGFAQSNTASRLNCSNGLLQNSTSAFVGLDLTAPGSAGQYYLAVTTYDDKGGASSATSGISVKTPASISVTPSFSSKKISAGDTFALSATLDNGGQTNVTNATITISLPSNYFLAPDESQPTKPLDAGSSVSWNVVAPTSPDASDRTITLTPFGNDQNTGTPAPATRSIVTVRATAVSVTAVVDKTSAVYGERVGVSGYVKEGTTPLKTAYVSLVTGFGSRQTTYTDTSGYYSFAVFMPDRSGEQKLDVTATHGDMSGSASASVFVGELLVTATVNPASINKGESATIRGKTTKSGFPVSGAEVTTKIGTKTYSTATDAYGSFSQSVTGTASGTNRVDVTVTSSDGKTGAAILYLEVAGAANKTIEISAPATVAPFDNFTVSGKLYSDGEKTGGTVEVGFAGTARSIEVPESGEFSLSLQAPEKEGCNDIVVKGSGFAETERRVCAYAHKYFTVSISARRNTPGPNVITIAALYEDGSPVSGSLAYGIEATQYPGHNLTAGAKLIEYNFNKAGNYYVSAYVNDGIRQKTFSRYLEINATAPSSPTPAPTKKAANVTTANVTATPTTTTVTVPPTAPEAARTNLALLLIGGIIILLLFF